MTIFYVVMIVVALFWALVIGIAIFNVLSAIKGKDKNENGEDADTHIETVAAIHNIAGMPAQTYYSTYTTNNTTLH